MKSLLLALLGSAALIQAARDRLFRELVSFQYSAAIPDNYIVARPSDIHDGLIVAIRNFNGAFLHLTPDAKLRAGEPGVIPANSSGYFRITRPHKRRRESAHIYIRSVESGMLLCDGAFSNLCVNRNNPFLWESFYIHRFLPDKWVTMLSHMGRLLSSNEDGSVTFEGFGVPHIGSFFRSGESDRQAEMFQLVSVKPVASSFE